MEDLSVHHQNQTSRREQSPRSRLSRRRLVALTLAGLAAPALGRAAAQSQVRAPWQAQVAPLPTVDIQVGDEWLTVEVAADPASRGRGLGYREGLAPGTGMLFVFPEARERSFWMQGMRFCLDIVWINDGQILGAAEGACPDPPGTPNENRARFRSDGPAQYVLEVPGGWLAEHGYGAGTPVQIPDGLLVA
jgi:uncharacterized membrane protein (UPF0127 family)